MAIIYTAAPLQQPTQPGASGATGYQDILVMRAAVKFGTCRDILESDLGYRSEKYWYNYLYPGETLRAMTTQSYRVAEETATDHHVMTKGGLKLYVLPNDGKITLQQCGAMLDGVTDDTEALRLALDILPEGGTLSIGGTALIQGSAQPALPRSGITVTEGTIRRSFSGAADVNTPVFDLNGWTRCLFELTFDLGNATSASRETAFILRGCEDVTFRNCAFDDCHYGILGSNATSRDIRLIGCRGYHDAPVQGEGGGAMIFGNGVMDNVKIDQCEGLGWQHLVLSGDAERWTVTNSSMDESGDSAIYLRGSQHRVDNCWVRRAGKDGIKILDYQSGARGTQNIVANCHVFGAGYVKSDGGVCVNIETDHSKISGLVLQLDDVSALASAATAGINLSGEDMVVENVVVRGAGLNAVAGEGVGVLVNNSSRDTAHITLMNIRATSLRYGCALFSRAGMVVSNVVLRDLWCRDVDTGVMAYDLSGNTRRLHISGGGVTGTSGHGMTFAGIPDVRVQGVDFAEIPSDSYCFNLREGTEGLYTGCAWDGSARAPVKSDGTGTGRQIDNDWNRSARADGPFADNWWWIGDQVRFAEAAPGETPGQTCVTAGRLLDTGVFADEPVLPL